jgi:periplasmic divalent cation tolerance protein
MAPPCAILCAELGAKETGAGGGSSSLPQSDHHYFEPNMTAAIFVYVTAPDLDVAERIATAIVEEGLAACANLLPGMRSIYRWKGAVERADEIVLLLKTTPSRFDALEARVRELHPHETPCVVALPINRGSAPYLDWIVDETSP